MSKKECADFGYDMGAVATTLPINASKIGVSIGSQIKPTSSDLELAKQVAQLQAENNSLKSQIAEHKAKMEQLFKIVDQLKK